MVVNLIGGIVEVGSGPFRRDIGAVRDKEVQEKRSLEVEVRSTRCTKYMEQRWVLVIRRLYNWSFNNMTVVYTH